MTAYKHGTSTIGDPPKIKLCPQKTDRQSLPVRASIEINSDCNMICPNCSQKEQSKELSLSPEIRDRLFCDLTEMGVIEINIRGGEPTIDPDFHKTWDQATSHNSFWVNMTTNGLLLDVDLAENLIKHRRASITVSLDGPEPVNARLRGPGQYEKVMGWLPQIISAYPEQIRVLSLLSEQNLHTLPHLARSLAGMGLRHYDVTPLKRIGGAASMKTGFVDFQGIKWLNRQLLDIAEIFHNFAPTVNCRYLWERRGTETVPTHVYTEYWIGAGMRVFADGRVGISQSVFLTKEVMLQAGVTPLTDPAIGCISEDQRRIQQIWEDAQSIRETCVELASLVYPYVLGWVDGISRTRTLSRRWALEAVAIDKAMD